MAKDGVLDMCYTTEQYIKRLNDQVYEAYLRHKPFEDFYSNLTISSPELQQEFMCNLFLVELSQYFPNEVHVSEVIEYSKAYFAKFNLPKETIEAFFQDIISPQGGFMNKFLKITGMNNKQFSILKERISDLQDEYPQYNLETLTLGKNLNSHDDYYTKKNAMLSHEKKKSSMGNKKINGHSRKIISLSITTPMKKHSPTQWNYGR